jgi:diguanylate cyclase (GGDEF)-like protein
MNGISMRPPDSGRDVSRASDVTRSRVDPSRLFSYAVILIGIGVGAIIGLSGGFSSLKHPPLALVVLAELVVAGELVVLRLPARASNVALSASPIFAYATAMRYGPGAAFAALSFAALLKAVADKRSPERIAWSVAQRGATVGLAGLAYQHLGGSAGVLTSAEIPWDLAGAIAYLAIDYTLTETDAALRSGARLLPSLVRGLGVWGAVEGVMLGLAPIVPIVAEHSLYMIPLLLLPFLGVFYSSRVALAAEHASMHDALTGLPNRVLFRTRVEEALGRARHSHSGVLVMVLDLDRFKEVNDTLGHGRGDALLEGIAERLRTALRGVDLVARLGGDEFGVVVTSTPWNPRIAGIMAQRISSALETPFQLGDLWISVGTSIGVACSPDHGDDPEKLIQRADVAMYQSKVAGTGYEQYDSQRDPNRPDNLRVLQELREGIDKGELILHYQPKASIPDRTVIGVEALVRWNHPTRGLLMPGDFIELAERTELVRSLTMEVVRQAVRQCALWRGLGMTIPVAVNLSPRILLDVALPADIAQVLEEEQLPPELLEMEVTESCLIADPERSAEVLGRISETGVRISIDDFGTGYSSLALLKRLPVDTLKIDRSFVGNLANDPDDMVIVESTVKLALGLGLEVIAEGVEDEQTWELLAQFGCRQAQGFYFCRPLPARGLMSWIKAEAQHPDHAAAGA